MAGMCRLTAAGDHAQVAATGWAADGISVIGSGELMARPHLIEIDLFVAGKAELTGDALVKHRDAKKRLLEALEKLNLPTLSTSERGLMVSAGTSLDQQQRMMNGMPQTPSKTQMAVASTIRVQLKEVREIAPEELLKTVGKLLDTAHHSGVTASPSRAEVMHNARYGNYMGNT